MTGERPRLEVLQQEHIVIASAHELRRWLTRCARRSEGIWVVTWKKRAGAPCVDRWAVLDELLCVGWIDGVRRRVDAQQTAQWVSPRRHTVWTHAYRQRFAALVGQGRVLDEGFAAKRRAVDAGTWLGLPEVDRLELPADLLTALLREPAAQAWFMDQAPAYRCNVLRWLARSRRADTRELRIAAVVRASSRRKRLLSL